MNPEEINQDPQDNPQQSNPPAIKHITRKLSRKHKAFADAYLLTLNASEAYRAVFKPKHPEYAYKRAYAVLKDEGVSRYIDEALAESTDAEYRPEAIKQGIRNLAMTAKRESDRLRAYELMSKISGLINESAQVNVVNVNDDIMKLARQRAKAKLSEHKESAESQLVIDAESSQVIDTQGDTASMSYNSDYGQEPFNHIVSTNDRQTVEPTLETTNTGDSLVEKKDSPLGTGGQEPPPTPESNSKAAP